MASVQKNIHERHSAMYTVFMTSVHNGVNVEIVDLDSWEIIAEAWANTGIGVARYVSSVIGTACDISRVSMTWAHESYVKHGEMIYSDFIAEYTKG